MAKRFVFLLAVACLPGFLFAQDMEYRLTYRQKVLAGYNNLLSTSRQENFSEYVTSLQARLSVSFVNPHRFVLVIQGEDTARNTLQLPGKPVWVSLTNQYQVDSIFFIEQPTRDEEIATRTILSLIQYFRQEHIPVNHSSNEEFIENDYWVRYSTGNAGKNGLQRISKEMINSSTGIAAFQRLIVDEYCASYVVNPVTGFIDSISITERKHQKIQNKIIAFVKSTFELQPVTGKNVLNQNNLPAGTGSLFGTRIYNKPDPLVRNKLISERLLQNQGFEQLKQQLQKIAELSFEQRAQLAGRFRAWAFLHPGEVQAIEQLMTQYSFYSDECNVLLDAIVNTPHPQTQQLLFNSIHLHRNDHEALRVLLPKAAGSVLPGRNLIDLLFDIKIQSTNREISSLAGLCLSNMLREIKDKMKGTYDSVLVRLQQYYKQEEKNDDNILQFLAESGNTGDTIFINAIAEYLHTGNSDVQREALYALRFMQGGKADELIAGQLNNKNIDSASFKSVYEVLKMRYPAAVLVSAITRFIQVHATGNEAACLQLIEYLGSYIDEMPAPDVLLKSIKTTPAISKAIKEVLEKYYHYRAMSE